MEETVLFPGLMGHTNLRPASLSHFQDLMNDLFATIFLLGGIAFANEARRELPMPYMTAMVRCFLLSCGFPQITVKQILGSGAGRELILENASLD